MTLQKNQIVLVVALVVLAVAGVLFWRAWPSGRTDMAGYAPSSSLVFLEVNRIPEVAGGLAGTDAWKLAAPAFGLPSRMEIGGPVATALADLGIAPDDASALARAQLAAVVTGLEAVTEPSSEGTEEGASLVLRPRFALLVETHLPGRAVRETVRSRLPEVAGKLFGAEVAFEEWQYGGVDVTTAHPPAGNRRLVCAVREGLVIVANNPDAARAVLDAAAGATPSLAQDFFLARVRPEVAADKASMFAYFSEAGVGKLVGVGPGVVAGTITADPEKAATVSRLFGGMSEKAVKALGYSATFEDGGVVDRYFTILAPPVAEALSGLRPGPADAPALAFVPEGATGLTYVRTEDPGRAFDAVLAAVSSSVDAGTAIVLGQIAIELRRSYGVEPDRPIAPALGDEVLFVDFGEGQPLAAVFAARDRAALLPVAETYLRREGTRVSTETYNGVEILRASGEDGRAVALVDGYAVVATRDQIALMVDARAAGGRGAAAARRALERSPDAVLVSQREDHEATGDLLLAISGAFGTGDGGPGSLDPVAARDALAQLPPSATAARARGGGLYAESRSAVGGFTYLTAVLGGPDVDDSSQQPEPRP